MDPPHRSLQSARQLQTAGSSRSPLPQRLLRTARPNHILLVCNFQPLVVRCNGSYGFGSQPGRVRSLNERRLASRTWRSQYGNLSRLSFRRRKSRGGWTLRAFRRRGGRHVKWRSREGSSGVLMLEGDILRTPMAVEPSLIASSEYSTWKRRPSGENVLTIWLGPGHLGEESRDWSYFMPRSAGDISWWTRWERLA